MAKQVTIQNDIGHKQTDDKISELEKKIKKEYEQAAKEAEKKWKDYLKAFERKDKLKQQQLKAGLISKSEYDKWRTGQIMIGKRWDEMRRTLATDLANSSEICRSMTEGYMPEVYALNHDYATFLIEADSLVNTSYTLYDRQAVERLIRDNPQLLPDMSDKTAEKIRKGELIKWNEQQLTSSVTQGILQGESIPHLAKRIRGVAQMDYNASIRNARTMMGNAESAGRIDSMKRAEGMGIKMQKRWLSTLDNRTRHEHRLLMGQTKPVDEPFVVGQYEIMYPCDSRADPAMVYNCRCAMTSVFAGYDKQITDYEIDERLGGMTYEEWRHAKEKPAPLSVKIVVNAKDQLLHEKLSKLQTVRPTRSDFDNDDKYREARQKYREDKEKATEIIEKWYEEKTNGKAITQEEFAEWCEKHGVAMGNIEGLDMTALKLYTERYEQLSKDFPIVEKWHNDLGFKYWIEYNKDGLYNAEASRGMTFGSPYASGDFKDTMIRGVFTDGFVRGANPIDNTFDHEFGHNVYCAMRTSGKSHTREELEYNRQLHNDLITFCHNKEGESEYATTNDDELFAEAFCAWYGGEQTEFAKGMEMLLKKYGVI